MKSMFDLRLSRKATSLRGRHLISSVLLLGAAACTGEIGDVDQGGSGPGTSTSTGVGPSTSSSTVAGGTGGTTMPAVDPGTKGVHRLNSNEYNATVADVLGTKLQPANSSWRGGEIGGFDNIAAVLETDEAQYQRYFDTAGLIADDVFAAVDLKAKIVTCATADDNACVQGIISNTGKRIFRRPLGTDEVGTYQKVYTAARQLGESHEGSIKQVLRSLLSSAEFLYRIELDPNPSSTEKHPLSAYELASRLSYFLWSSAPDDALLASAADSSLTQNTTLESTVDRMLAEPVKGSRFVENFAGQWLGARKLPDHAVFADVYPDWTPQLATSLTKEMYLYFGEFLKSDRPWADFLHADINFVDASIAKLYGVAAPAASAGQPMSQITTDNRFGFFGLGGFQALSSIDRRTSPTLRGRWIMINLLCTEPPAPPPGVPELTAGPFDPTKNVKKALEEHRKSPACAACHGTFDPYGMSLEQFDGIGKFRTTYADGATIDSTTELAPSDLFPQGAKFSGLKGLADTLSSHPAFQQCIGDNLFTYGIGRLINNDTDRPYLNAIHDEWTKGTPSIRRLIHSMVLAEPFRFRHGTPAK
jgi:hypothetical protein